MRTLTALTLATALLFAVGANAATTHKKHHNHASQKTEKSAKADAKAPAKQAK